MLLHDDLEFGKLGVSAKRYRNRSEEQAAADYEEALRELLAPTVREILISDFNAEARRTQRTLRLSDRDNPRREYDKRPNRNPRPRFAAAGSFGMCCP